VTLISPANGEQLPDGNFAFSWTPFTGATMYDLEIEDTGPVRSKIDHVIRETSLVEPGMRRWRGAFRWRVTPVDDNLRYVGADPSPWWTFTIG
jgi:hypothetical protein